MRDRNWNRHRCRNRDRGHHMPMAMAVMSMMMFGDHASASRKKHGHAGTQQERLCNEFHTVISALTTPFCSDSGLPRQCALFKRFTWFKVSIAVRMVDAICVLRDAKCTAA